MHPRFVDLTGQTFHYLTAIEYLGQKGNKSHWLCECKCGNRKSFARDKLMTGDTKSCGCYAKELPHSQLTHGCSGTPEYYAWLNAKDRCYNPNYKFFHRYGGRGIRVHEQWINDFQSFIDHIGPRPSKEYSLDRIDNDGDYEPGNVHWVTQDKQSRNRSTNVEITINGHTRCMAEWCQIYGIHKATVSYRIKKGWDPVRAVQQPSDPSKSRSRA